MNRGQITAVVLLAAAAGGAGYFVSRHQSAPVDQVVAVPVDGAELRAVPDFSLTDLAGETRSGSEWSDQVRIVNFWATWCPPCRREIPLLIDLQQEYGDRMQVIGIAIDDLADVQSYAEETGFNYPVLVGQQEAIDLGNAFLPDFVGLPFTVIVDAENRIAKVHMGELHRDEAEAMLAEVL